VSPVLDALLVAGWVCGWLLAGRRDELPAEVEGHAGVSPRVSVVVPARDEAQRLPTLLECLHGARPHPDEIIVVDDASADATADLARASGARVLTVDASPGWTDKAWACWRGARVASGDVLVFLDADTEPAPGAIDVLARRAAAGGGFVSAQPWHRVERAYERLSAWCNVLTVIGAGTGGPNPRRWWRRPVVFGAAVAVPRDVYFAVDGHAAVRGEVAEDLALARRADARGVPVMSFTGGPSLRFRMYPEGAGRLFEGWSKNLLAGAGSLPRARLVAAVTWITGALGAVSVAVGAAWSAGRGGVTVPPAAAAAAYAAYAVQAFALMRRVGRFGLGTAALYAIPLVAFGVFFARASLLVVARRPVRWRGRVVPASRS
jgi:4,4'-diaponeurosporenoate glycosyltransferase